MIRASTIVIAIAFAISGCPSFDSIDIDTRSGGGHRIECYSGDDLFCALREITFVGSCPAEILSLDKPSLLVSRYGVDCWIYPPINPPSATAEIDWQRRAAKLEADLLDLQGKLRASRDRTTEISSVAWDVIHEADRSSSVPPDLMTRIEILRAELARP